MHAGGLPTEPGSCGTCDVPDGEPVAVGPDLEYRTSGDEWLAWRCRRCGTVYLDPRPAPEAFPVIYPDHYHAFEFSEDEFGLVHRARTWLEARRLAPVVDGLPTGARILDVGCGDGFHLAILARHGSPTWRLEGVDIDARAVAAARRRGLEVHHGAVEALDLPAGAYHLVLCMQTIEHVLEPATLLGVIAERLVPGGRVHVVTDNTASPDARWFRRRHWGGYHFPRHLHLYDAGALGTLARRVGLRVRRVRTILSPVNWVYSLRNLLVDAGAPDRVARHLSLRAPVALAAGTVWDAAFTAAGRGALLAAELERP